MLSNHLLFKFFVAYGNRFTLKMSLSYPERLGADPIYECEFEAKPSECDSQRDFIETTEDMTRVAFLDLARMYRDAVDEHGEWVLQPEAVRLFRAIDHFSVIDEQNISPLMKSGWLSRLCSLASIACGFQQSPRVEVIYKRTRKLVRNDDGSFTAVAKK